MPARRFRRRKPQKKRARRKPNMVSALKKRFPGTVYIPRAVVPNMVVVKLTYVDLRQYDLSGFNFHTETKVFRMNSINDPDQNSGGHKPMGWDEWNSLFRTYVVLESTAKVTAQLNNASGFNQNVIFSGGVNRNSQNSEYDNASIERRMELPWTQYRILGAPGASNSQKTITFKYNAKNFWGRDPMTDANQESTNTIDPVNQAYLNLQLEDKEGGAGIQYINMNTVLTQLVVFRHPRVLGQST